VWVCVCVCACAFFAGDRYLGDGDTIGVKVCLMVDLSSGQVFSPFGDECGDTKGRGGRFSGLI